MSDLCEKCGCADADNCPRVLVVTDGMQLCMPCFPLWSDFKQERINQARKAFLKLATQERDP